MIKKIDSKGFSVVYGFYVFIHFLKSNSSHDCIPQVYQLSLLSAKVDSPAFQAGVLQPKCLACRGGRDTEIL